MHSSRSFRGADESGSKTWGLTVRASILPARHYVVAWLWLITQPLQVYRIHASPQTLRSWAADCYLFEVSMSRWVQTLASDNEFLPWYAETRDWWQWGLVHRVQHNKIIGEVLMKWHWAEHFLMRRKTFWDWIWRKDRFIKSHGGQIPTKQTKTKGLLKKFP